MPVTIHGYLKKKNQLFALFLKQGCLLINLASAWW